MARVLGRMLVACTVCLTALPAAATGRTVPIPECAINNECARISADGARIVFSSIDRLVRADRNQGTDVYEFRPGGKVRLLTRDSSGLGSKPLAIATDGSRVLIESLAPFSPTDTDTNEDLYALDEAGIRLITPGPNTRRNSAEFAGVTPDLRHIYFSTTDDLVSTDRDHDHDLYEWTEGQIKIVATGPGEFTSPVGAAVFPSVFGGASDDGSLVYFWEGEDLVTAPPGDPYLDRFFVRVNGTETRRISVPGDLEGPLYSESRPWGTTIDGSKVFVDTNIPVVPGDTDIFHDVYQFADGQWSLLSGGVINGNGEDPSCSVDGTYRCRAHFRGTSDDGERIVFQTAERLLPNDADTSMDLYLRSPVGLELISVGPSGGNTDGFAWPEFAGISRSGQQLAFSTPEALLPADGDRRPDIYLRGPSGLTLASTGPEDNSRAYTPTFGDFTDDGTSLVFLTRDPLVSCDKDKQLDIYERFYTQPNSAAVGAALGAGKTRLVSLERIPPKLRIGARGKVSNGRALVRIGCPRKEQSGCRGVVTASGGRGGRFNLRQGKKRWVSAGTSREVGRKAQVRVRVRDAQGNKAVARKRVRF
jgi:hypothetical protein